MKVKRVAVGEYATNCYIIIFQPTKKKRYAYKDPSFDIPRIEHFVGDKQVTGYSADARTHRPYIRSSVLREKYGAKVYIGKHDAPLLKTELCMLRKLYGILRKQEISVDVLLFEDGDEVVFCSDYKFRVLELPGHTPGGIVLRRGGALFLRRRFVYRSCGRTDF